MPGPDRSPKGSPGKGGKNSPGKKSSKVPGEDHDTCNKYFNRRRYEDMDAVFVQRGPVISIYARSIHLYEIWNRLPPYEQFNCSASVQKSPNSPNKSLKGGAVKRPVTPEEKIAKPALEPAVITGVVCLHKSSLQEGQKLYIEVTAEFRYSGYAKVPPYPDNVITKCQCFRDVQCVHPVNFDEERDVTPFNQQIIFKLRKDLGRGFRTFQYVFDLTRKPDSVFFTRPYYPDLRSGLFWRLRAYVAPDEGCIPNPGDETTMEFFKYTICPALTPFCLHETPPVEYTRYCTQNDTGDLILQAQLDRDIYYHGQDIKVKINIENNSARHVIDMIAVFLEQTYRLFHQFPHDSSNRLGETILKTGDPGMPINPRSKNFTKEVLIRPQYEQTKYNLAIDGKMPVDNKVFLASSTIIMNALKIANATVEEPVPSLGAEGRASPKGSPGGKKASPVNKNGSSKSKSSGKSKSPTKEENPAINAPPSGVAAGGEDTGTPKTDAQEPILEPRLVVNINEVNHLTSKQVCRSVFVAYDVVVRLNLSTPQGTEAGHPEVRVPFILTRESRSLNKYATAFSQPVWGSIKPH